MPADEGKGREPREGVVLFELRQEGSRDRGKSIALDTQPSICGKALSGLNQQDLMRIPYLTLESRPVRGPKPLEIRIPLADLARELKDRLPLTRDLALYPRAVSHFTPRMFPVFKYCW